MKAKKRKVMSFSQVDPETWIQCTVDNKLYGPEYIKMLDWTIKNTNGFHARADDTFWFEDPKDAFMFKLKWGAGNEQK